MKKLILILFLFVKFLNVNAQEYSLTATNSTFSTISTTADVSFTHLDFSDSDEGYKFYDFTSSTDFRFNYNGTSYSSFYITSSGFINFTSPMSSSFFGDGVAPMINAHSEWTFSVNDDIIAPLWTDLNIRAAYIKISSDPPGNRVMTIQFDNSINYGTQTNLTFQIKLYEGSNNIEFIYGGSTYNGIPPSFDDLVNDGLLSVGLNFKGVTTNNYLCLNELTTNAKISSSNPLTDPRIIYTSGLSYLFTPIPSTFANSGPITICQKGSYFLAPSTTTGTWLSSDPSVASVDSKGYITGLITGTTTISLSNAGGTISVSVTVGSNSELTITDTLAQASYKFNNNPQGPIGSKINYVGYNGYNYSSQNRPINTGFYRASNQSIDNAGCPYDFYIFRCSTCGTASTYSSRPQGNLIGDTIQSNGIGKLKFVSSNDLVGPFTIVYQLIGGAKTTVNHISSGEAFNINAFASSTSFKLISVTDETTNSSTDFSNVIGTISVVPQPTATLTGSYPSGPICAGGTAYLSVSLTGTGSITITLDDNTVTTFPAGTKRGYITVTPSVNTTYTISSVIDRSGAGTFDGTASVTINDAGTPVITVQPIATVTIDEGTSTTLSVTATGATGYQWYKDGNEIIDATTISYTTVNTLSATGTYYVIVNGACSTTVSSTNSVVSVTAMPQGSLTGSEINEGETGYLSFISSNNPVGGPFTIVYQPSGGSNITVSNVTSGATISVTTGTPTRTTTYTLVSVIDENTTLSRTTGFTGATATITTFVELALSLDAGNLSSYPGNGNIWYDLSSNGINPTFITGATAPTFSPLYGGIFNFDGNQDMTLPLDDLPYGNTAFTLNAWAKATSIDGSCNFIIAYGNPTYGQTRFLGSCDGNYNFGGFGGPPTDVQGTAFPLNTWVNMTGTYDGTTAILYVDGVQIATGTPNWNTVQQSGFIGKQVGGLTQRWNGSISNIQLYNKALTATEVLNNYNNSKSRFSLSNVAIGTQIWTDKNLDVTTYRNGDVIAQITNTTDWENATEGAWCYYNNDPTNEAIYGKLYNWYAVNDPRGLAPEGWHVPTDAEWTTLGTFLGGNEVAGGKMKSIGTSVWNSPNTDATNSSGFTGLPGGNRREDGLFLNKDDYGFWWSYNNYQSSLRFLYFESGILYPTNYSMKNGFSVRLIKD